MKKTQMGGIRISPFGQQISVTDLNTGSTSWKGNLQHIHRAVSAPGIIHPRWNLRPVYNGTGTSFDLTSGTVYANSFTVQGSSPEDTRDMDFPSSVFIKPSYIEKYPGVMGPLTPQYDEAEGVLSGIPLADASPSLSVFTAPGSGGSLLLGDLGQRSFIWIVYYGDVDVPTLNDSGVVTYSAFVESFRIATTTAQDFQEFADTGASSSFPTFLTQAFSAGRATLLGAVSPVGGVILEDSLQLIPEYYYPATGEPWPYPTSRPEGGLKDPELRAILNEQNLTLGALPSRFVENRFYNRGSSGATSQSFFGDFCRETNLKVVSTPDTDYTGVTGDNILTQSGDPLGGPFTGLTHFPYTLLSVIGADGKDYTANTRIVPMKKYLSFGDAKGVPLGQIFTVTYGWMNVCEPQLDASASPPRVMLNQPLDSESIVVGTSNITTLPGIVKSVLAPQHFPGEYIISVSGYDGLMTVSPKHLISPATASALNGTTVYPIAQPLSPTSIAVYLTDDTTTPPVDTLDVYIYGVLDTGEDNYTPGIFSSVSGDVLTLMHPMTWGAAKEVVMASTGTAGIVGLADGTSYWVIPTDTGTEIMLASSAQAANSGTSITLGVYGGTGEISFVPVPERVTVDSSSRIEIREGLSAEVPEWSGRFATSANTYQYIRKLVFSGSGASYCCVLSVENVNPWYELPVYSFIFDSSGNYIPPTFKDLRRRSFYIQGSFTHQDTGNVTTTDGTIMVEVTAGETLSKGNLVYIKPQDGFAYNALAENKPVSNDALSQVQVLGVVYPSAITAGASGEVMCRGLFRFSPDDPMGAVYAPLTPGVIALSKDTPGHPTNVSDLIEWIKAGDKPYTPVIRVIEAFGTPPAGD